MKIIDLEMRHIGEVEQIERQCFSAPWTRQNILDTMQNGHSIFLAAILTDGQKVENHNGDKYRSQCQDQIKCGETVAGYISADAVCETAYINNVAVAADFRRKGIGRELISALEQRSRARGCTEITLEVRSKNAAAKTLYENCGYRKCGERKNYYHDPADNAEIMTKKL